MTFLLEVAVGDVDALTQAVGLTDHPRAILQEAAGFFIEQVLLSKNGDHHRTLGASKEASYAELRRHMALLIKWAHPDLLSGGASGSCLDRSVYANRVTKAWEALKTGARRNASNNRPTQETGGRNISKHPVIGILLRIDELSDEAGPDGESLWSRPIISGGHE